MVVSGKVIVRPKTLETWMVEGQEKFIQDREVLIAGTLVDPRSGMVPVKLDCEPKLINKRTVIAQLEAVEIVMQNGTSSQHRDTKLKPDKTDNKEDVTSNQHRATKVKPDETDDKQDVTNSQHSTTVSDWAKLFWHPAGRTVIAHNKDSSIKITRVWYSQTLSF